MTLSNYIRDNLAAAIRAGDPISEKLTIKRLADAYGVSATPVRAAVDELVRSGLMVKKPNGRLTVGELGAVEGDALHGTESQPPKDHFQIISQDVLRLSLKGEPVFLREMAMEEKYGVSRTVIRQVFAKLAGSGVLEHLPRRGWRIRPFSKHDMESFLEVRECLEMKALDLAWPRLETKELRRLLDRHVVRAEGQWCEVDNSLHHYIIDASQNHYIVDFFERNGGYYDLLFKWEGYDKRLTRETCLQHREILEALLDRDKDSARAALVLHIRANRRVLLDRDPWHGLSERRREHDDTRQGLEAN